VEVPPVLSNPSQRAIVPEWLANLAALGWRILATLALAAVLALIAVKISTVVISVLVALIVAATFAPFALRLRARGWSRTAAAGAVTLLALAVIVVTLIFVALSLAPSVGSIIGSIQTGLDTLSARFADLSLPPEVAQTVQTIVAGFDQWLSDGVKNIAAAAGMVGTIAVLGGLTTFFLLQDGDKAWVWAMQAAGEWQRDRITSSGHDALDRVGGYLRGTAVVAAITAVSDFVFMVILGVPFAGALAVVVFFGAFIPLIGGVVTTIIVALVAFGTVGPQATIVLLILIGIANVLRANFLQPFIYGKTVHIAPWMVLVALPAGAAIAGIIGVFAVIPVVAFILAVTGSLIAVLDDAPEARAVAVVPAWLDRLAQWSWRLLVAIALVGALVALAVQIPTVVLPIVIALVLGSTFLPLIHTLTARGWSSGRAAIAVTLGTFLVVTFIVFATIASLVGPLSEMVQNAISGADKSSIGTGNTIDWLKSFVQQYGQGLLGAAATVVSNLATLTVILLLGLLLTFFALRDGPRGWAAVTARVPGWRRDTVSAAGKRATDVLGGYMIATGVISAFAAVTQWLIMTILGLPFALPLAVLAFFGGFIPYIGSLLTTALAFLVAVAVGTTQDVVIMGIYTVIFNVIQGSFVAPIVYGRAVNIHPAIVLLAIPAGNEIAGVIGMFLVVPFIGVVAATWRTVLRVFGTEPPPPLDEAELADAGAGDAGGLSDLEGPPGPELAPGA
jgi:predicted PurR-regulated permease PerM